MTSASDQHTVRVERQVAERGLIARTARQRTAVEVEVMRRAEDEDTVAAASGKPWRFDALSRRIDRLVRPCRRGPRVRIAGMAEAIRPVSTPTAARYGAMMALRPEDGSAAPFS